MDKFCPSIKENIMWYARNLYENEIRLLPAVHEELEPYKKD